MSLKAQQGAHACACRQHRPLSPLTLTRHPCRRQTLRVPLHWTYSGRGVTQVRRIPVTSGSLLRTMGAMQPPGPEGASHTGRARRAGACPAQTPTFFFSFPCISAVGFPSVRCALACFPLIFGNGVKNCKMSAPPLPTSPAPAKGPGGRTPRGPTSHSAGSGAPSAPGPSALAVSPPAVPSAAAAAGAGGGSAGPM